MNALWTSVPTTLEEERLRLEVREFLRDELPEDYVPGLGIAAAHDPAFTRRLAARGWVGMSVPKAYGGTDRSAVHRFIVTEELLAAGAPIGAHFIAERQSAPMIVRYGSRTQREFFLPKICEGECWFSIGMSEPDAGSDLGAVRTTAAKVDGGLRVTGTKVWTTAAHLNHYMVTLCRTSKPIGRRHEGLSQLVVDLAAPGVTVRPIEYINGRIGFNEVILDDVFVPDEMVLGELGSGWKQVTSELAFERSGPDRYLSAYGVLKHFVSEQSQRGFAPEQIRAIGDLTAHLWSIRQLSLSIARAIDAGDSPSTEAAIVKDLGTRFEQRMVEVVRNLSDVEVGLGTGSVFERLLAEATVTSPAFTLRGGTTEILRSIASKGLAS